MPSNRYTQDTIALPPHLVTRCRAAIGGYYRVVTFRAGGPFSKTEAELGPVLANECRSALEAHWEEARSMRIYVKGSHGQGRLARSERAAIAYLSGLGHGPQAIADVLGLGEDTVVGCPTYSVTAGQAVTKPEHLMLGSNVLMKRLGKAHPHRDLAQLAARLGVADEEVRERARFAGAAYAALKNAHDRSPSNAG